MTIVISGERHVNRRDDPPMVNPLPFLIHRLPRTPPPPPPSRLPLYQELIEIHLNLRHPTSSLQRNQSVRDIWSQVYRSRTSKSHGSRHCPLQGASYIPHITCTYMYRVLQGPQRGTELDAAPPRGHEVTYNMHRVLKGPPRVMEPDNVPSKWPVTGPKDKRSRTDIPPPAPV